MTAYSEPPSMLQLWVEHGLSISQRYATIHSHFVASHNAAATARASAISYNPPPPSKKGAPPALAPRGAIWTRRKQVRAARKALLERLKEVDRREKEAERREEERKEEERRARERRDGERREQEEVERRERERRDKEEREKKEREEKEEEKRKEKEREEKLKEEKKKKQEARLKSGLRRAILAESEGEGDLIADLNDMPEDVERVVKTWNATCGLALQFRKDARVRKIRMEVVKRVNLTCNQIAASVKSVSMKVDALVDVIATARSHGGEAGDAFARKEVAMRLVREADGTVALNRTAAFAVGAVLVGVCARVEMKEVVLGAFYRCCLYTLPAYAKRAEGENVDDFRTRIGYKDGETAESYMERMCGYIGLFAAVLQTETAVDGNRNPFPIDLGWTWLARIANREQRAITPAIAFAFLEIAGYAMTLRYRRQFAKLMAMIEKAVIYHAVKSAPPGAISRMRVLIDEFITAGCTFKTPPEGRSLPQRDAEFL